MKKIYLIPLLCVFTFSLAFSRCGCGNPGCGGCSTQTASQSAGEDWRCCSKGCDCTKMGCSCCDCGCDIPEDAFVALRQGAEASAQEDRGKDDDLQKVAKSDKESSSNEEQA